MPYRKVLAAVDLTDEATQVLERAREVAQQNNAELSVIAVVKPINQVYSGFPADEIRAMAEQLDVDLIIMGTHGRHGLGLLLGSTATGVLHGCPCDVLTIRIR
jgi:universal stress protein A